MYTASSCSHTYPTVGMRIIAKMKMERGDMQTGAIHLHQTYQVEDEWVRVYLDFH